MSLNMNDEEDPQRAAANPWIHDKIQLVTGARYLDRRIAAQTACLDPHSPVLDAGGGTGSVGSLWADT
jgi:hypothetical protein